MLSHGNLEVALVGNFCRSTDLFHLFQIQQKTVNWQSDLTPLVILVMYPKMHAIHVFKRPQTSKLISSCLMIAIQYYMVWNLITL